MNSDADAPSPCRRCGGHGFISHSVSVESPDFGKLFPCPVCVSREREDRDWFEGLEANEDNARAIRMAKVMAYNPSGWLVLCGGVGTGKTTLGTAILSHWAGRPRVPQTTAEMLNRWRGEVRNDDFEELFRIDQDATRAVLDDLGVEKVTDWVVDRLTQYLDWRYIRRLPTVVTTNCDEDMVAVRLGQRIADRVFDQRSGLVRVVTLGGVSRRTGRAW